MDAADVWGRSSSSSSSSAAAARRLQARYDLYMGIDDADAGLDEVTEPRGGAESYNCPFCGEDFDFVGLCCHIDDEHAVEAKSGACPICATRVGMDLIGHLTMQHGSYFKMQRRRRVRKVSSGSHSLLSLLRKDLRNGSLQSFLGGSSYVSNPPAAAPDPFVSSLICTLPVAEPSKDLHSDSSDNNFLLNKFPDEKPVERAEPSLSEKDQKERVQRSKFVRGLVLSTIFDDDNL
ncbi:fiber protein Fb2 [Zea mays]|uniref:Fiber protein Fb2 n=3 Tax=Zea mays TaxID=4577 RepID=B4FIX0_MAIZE|nr:fiber protein Fb2 [Zea mays]ACF82063.1 unknown [Zea mays]ACG33284.1 fiber protein Fb2 [Zea mays]AQK85336.1 Protein DEHYDRATION-INDUCED 19 homolog 3 [Zea mays]|eukprot:NP_001148883.1 fiber protein Fb2 [Zea mays]